MIGNNVYVSVSVFLERDALTLTAAIIIICGGAWGWERDLEHYQHHGIWHNGIGRWGEMNRKSQRGMHACMLYDVLKEKLSLFKSKREP